MKKNSSSSSSIQFERAFELSERVRRYKIKKYDTEAFKYRMNEVDILKYGNTPTLLRANASILNRRKSKRFQYTCEMVENSILFVVKIMYKWFIICVSPESLTFAIYHNEKKFPLFFVHDCVFICFARSTYSKVFDIHPDFLWLFLSLFISRNHLRCGKIKSGHNFFLHSVVVVKKVKFVPKL